MSFISEAYDIKALQVIY